MEIEQQVLLDPLEILPYEILFHTFQFLAPPDLCRAACVSIAWQRLADDPALWKYQLKKSKWTPKNFVERVQHPPVSSRLNSPLIPKLNDEKTEVFTWKEYYIEQSFIYSNWLSGNFNLSCLEGHRNQFNSQVIVTCSDDTMVGVWDRNSTTLRTFLGGHSRSVEGLDLRGSYALSAGGDRTIREWNLEVSKCNWMIDNAHLGIIRAVQYHQLSTSGNSESHELDSLSSLVLSCSSENTVKIWDKRTSKMVKKLVGHLDEVFCMQARGWYIISGSFDNTLKIWDMRSWDTVSTLEHQASITCLQWDDDVIVSGDTYSNVKIWTSNGAGSVTSVDAPKCTKQIVVSDSDSPQNTTSEVSRTWNSPCSLWSLGFDDCKLVVGGFDGRTHLYDRNSWTLLHSLPAQGNGRVWGLSFDESTLMTAAGRAGFLFNFAHLTKSQKATCSFI